MSLIILNLKIKSPLCAYLQVLILSTTLFIFIFLISFNWLPLFQAFFALIPIFTQLLFTLKKINFKL